VHETWTGITFQESLRLASLAMRSTKTVTQDLITDVATKSNSDDLADIDDLDYSNCGYGIEMFPNKLCIGWKRSGK